MALARLIDRGGELPSFDIGSKGFFRNIAQFGCRQVGPIEQFYGGAQVKVVQFGQAE